MNVLAFPIDRTVAVPPEDDRPEPTVLHHRLDTPFAVEIVRGPLTGRGLAIAVGLYRNNVLHLHVVHEASGTLLVLPPDWMEDPAMAAPSVPPPNDNVAASPGEPARTCETCVSYGANTAHRGWCIRVAMMVQASGTCIATSGDRWRPWVEAVDEVKASS